MTASVVRSALTIAAVTMAVSQPAQAKVAPFPLETMIRDSELIVIAEVTAVRTEPPKELPRAHAPKPSYAVAKVHEVWKGPPTDTVQFWAFETWACDISQAKVGERVLLFLTHNPRITTKAGISNRHVIFGAGRGRLPLSPRGSRMEAELENSDVIVPSRRVSSRLVRRRVQDPDDPKFTFTMRVRFLDVESLRALVQEVQTRE